MIAHLGEADRAFALMEDYPAPELKEILANILYLGLPAAVKRIAAEQKPKRSKRQKDDVTAAES